MKRVRTKTRLYFLSQLFRIQSYLEQIYEEKSNDVKKRNKCEWCKFGEKSSKFFLNFEKQHVLLNQAQILPIKLNQDKHEINQELECFYKNLLTEKSEFETKRYKCLS